MKYILKARDNAKEENICETKAGNVEEQPWRDSYRIPIYGRRH